MWTRMRDDAGVEGKIVTRIDRSSLDRLARETPTFPDPWPTGAVDDLVSLLLCGSSAIADRVAFRPAELAARLESAVQARRCGFALGWT